MYGFDYHRDYCFDAVTGGGGCSWKRFLMFMELFSASLSVQDNGKGP